MKVQPKLILFTILILVAGFGLYYSGDRLVDFLSIPRELEESRDLYGAEKFYISGGDSLPTFTKEVIVDPFEVREGEEQIFSIWAEDNDAVEKLTAIIFNDAGEKPIELQLVEGTEKMGKWMGSWITKDISDSPRYSTVFKAINKQGEETKMTLWWLAAK